MESLHIPHHPGPSPSECQILEKPPISSPHWPGSKSVFVNLQTQHVSIGHHTPSQEDNPVQLMGRLHPSLNKTE
jgi:hypothetical protein